MANISKEEREKRAAEEKTKLETEIRKQIEADAEIIKKENNELKSQIDELKEMIKLLQEKEDSSFSISTSNDTITAKNDDIDMNTRITITSMTTGGVNLKTSNDGNARHFRLEKIGQTLPIVYEHLINCINTDRWIFEEGLVYINNAKAVEEQYLEEFYKKFLTPNTITNILDFDIPTIISLVSNTTTAIQETIATLVANKINDSGMIDMNKVDAIGKACSPNIDIRDLANKLR